MNEYRQLLLGEKVKFHQGGIGIVVSGYAPENDLWNKKGSPCKKDVHCCILWDDNEQKGNPCNASRGANISISIPSHTYRNEFNPIIRAVDYDNPVMSDREILNMYKIS